VTDFTWFCKLDVITTIAVTYKVLHIFINYTHQGFRKYWIYGIPRAAILRELWSVLYKYNLKIQDRYIGKPHGFGFIIFIDDVDALKMMKDKIMVHDIRSHSLYPLLM
jgi:hypothetical protein